MPGHAFFDQPQFECLFGDNFLQIARFTAQDFHLIGGSCARRIPGQPLLARFQKFLRPTVIKALGNTFTTAKSGNALLATQDFQHNADFIVRRVMLARRTADILDDVFNGRFLRPGFLSHLRFLCSSYDEPEIFSSQLNTICLKGADVGQSW